MRNKYKEIFRENAILLLALFFRTTYYILHLYMKLIVGLGNPGSRYRNSRHNVGFQFLDFIIGHSGGRRPIESHKDPIASLQDDRNFFRIDKYVEAEMAEVSVKNRRIILAKPQTFMNESGRAVVKIMSNVPSTSLRAGASQMSNLYIVHDDLDLRLGTYKIQKGVGPKLHNGIESIEKALGTKDFWRVRVGVDSRDQDRRTPGEDYVLQNFTEEELDSIKEVFNKIDIFSKF